MLAGVAFAQAPATKNAVAAQVKKATAPAKPAAAAAKPTMPASRPEHVAARAQRTTKHAAKAYHVTRKAVPSQTKKEEKPTAGNSETADNIAPEVKRGRDPFVSIIQMRTGNISCTGPGKKCLMPDQIMLRGVVRSQDESIAVVSSTANKTYFLRENDPVYNGVVVKITPDSIVFRESVTDRLGKTVQREVVKKVNNSAV
jgi:Tfp pilus assembly protein PilP